MEPFAICRGLLLGATVLASGCVEQAWAQPHRGTDAGARPADARADAQAATRAEARRQAQALGVLGVLREPGNRGAFASVLGSLDAGALGGMYGNSIGDAFGYGGLGLRGVGSGGGGTGQGTLGLGSIGTIGRGSGTGSGSGYGRGYGGIGTFRPRPRSTLDTEPVEAGPGLSREVVKNVLQRYRGSLASCYEAFAADAGTGRVRVVTRFTIGPQGRVTAVEIDPASTAPVPVGECFMRLFRRVIFPPPAGGAPVTVRYPVVFSVQP